MDFFESLSKIQIGTLSLGALLSAILIFIV